MELTGDTQAVALIAGGFAIVALIGAPMAVLALVRSRLAARASRKMPQLTAYEVACLRDGARAVVLASVSYLYVAGSIALNRPDSLPYVPSARWPPAVGLRVVSGLPARHSPVDAAIHDELVRRPGLRLGDLTAAKSVKAATTTMRKQLESGVSRFARPLFFLMLLLTLCATVLVIWGTALTQTQAPQHAPGGDFFFAVSCPGFLALVIAVGSLLGKKGSNRTDIAYRAIKLNFPEHWQKASWPTIGPAAVAYVVALYGADAAWKSDPTFARSAGARPAWLRGAMLGDGDRVSCSISSDPPPSNTD